MSTRAQLEAKVVTAISNMETGADSMKDPYPRVIDVAEIAELTNNLSGGFKSGRVTFTGAEAQKAVAFATAYADASYTVVALPFEGTVGKATVTTWGDSLLAAGFNLNISAAPGGADTVIVHWIAIKD